MHQRIKNLVLMLGLSAALCIFNHGSHAALTTSTTTGTISTTQTINPPPLSFVRTVPGCDPATAIKLSASSSRAYVGCGNSLKIYSITDPATPLLLGSVTLDHAIYDIAIKGTVAYVAGGYGSCATIVNAIDPTHPVVTTADYPGICSANIDVEVSSGELYISVYQQAGVGFNRIDTYLSVSNLADPAHPSNPGPPTGSGDVLSTLDMAITGTGSVVTIDELRNLNIYGEWRQADEPGYTEDAPAYLKIVASGKYIYAAKSPDEHNNGAIHVFDAFDPLAPVLVGQYVTSTAYIESFIGTQSVMGDYMAVRDGYFYLPQGNSGILILDVRNPASPIFKARSKDSRVLNATCITPNAAYLYVCAGNAFQVLKRGF